MKKRKIIMLMLAGMATLALGSCGKNDVTIDRIPVTFELEGGTFMESMQPLKYYYVLGEGGVKIFEPDHIEDNNEVKKLDHHIEGWYRNKEEDGSYSDKWDFNDDKLTAPITLYAKWERDIKCTYTIKFNDIDIEVIDVEAGNSPVTLSRLENFTDAISAYTDEEYTVVGFKDENGDVINSLSDLKHPGGEVDTDIPIYLNALKGDYALIRKFSDFSRVGKSKNIFVLNDIDCNGESLYLGDFNGRVFNGGNHTISNYVVDYGIGKPLSTETTVSLIDDDTMDDGIRYVSLFRDFTNSTLIDTCFKPANLDYKKKTNSGEGVDGGKKAVEEFRYAPLMGKIENSTIKNVSVEGKVTVQAKNESVLKCKYENTLAYHTVGNNVLENNIINIVKESK